MTLLPRILLFLAPAVLLGLSALPGALIRRSARRNDAEGVASFRDTLAAPGDLDPEQAALDAKWTQYWAKVDDDYLRSDLRARILGTDDPAHEIVEHFAEQAYAVVERFVAAAVRLQRDRANTYGGWTGDAEREAARWYDMAHGDLPTMSHLVAIDVTDTGSWTAADEEALKSYSKTMEARR
jgi:hypothetical protein